MTHNMYFRKSAMATEIITNVIFLVYYFLQHSVFYLWIVALYHHPLLLNLATASIALSIGLL